MGQSIPQEWMDTWLANKAAGRLCQGPVTSRLGCTYRATTKVRTQSWVYAVGEGAMTEHDATMCTKHAKKRPAGFEGVNFRILGQEKY